MEPLFLLPREDRRLVAGHLWAFSNEIDWKRSTRPEPGETRRLFSAQGRDLGLADTHCRRTPKVIRVRTHVECPK